MGLSGDLPIILVRVADDAHAQLLPAVIRAHQWWLRRGLRSDLVILREGASGYQEPIRDLLVDALHDLGVPEGLGGSGGVHLLCGGPIWSDGAADPRGFGATVTRRRGGLAH